MVLFLILSAVFLCLVLALVPHLLYAIVWVVGKIAHVAVPYRWFGYSALVLVVLCLLLLAYGYFVGRYRQVVKEVTFEHHDVPASFDGYRLVHISDLHVSSFKQNPANLQRVEDKINTLQPDMVCFTGDMVSFTADELHPYINVLQLLKAKDGIFAVLGNHDYATYVREFSAAQKQKSVDQLISLERDSLGWQLLLNESAQIVRGNDTLSVIGCENHSCSGNGISPIKRGRLDDAMSGTSGFRILLTHDPTHWRGEVLGKDIPLTLSGHTHAAQFRIFGWTPARWIYPESDGLYTQGDQSLYVNTGLGCTVPFRIGAPQEITVITLKHKE